MFPNKLIYKNHFIPFQNEKAHVKTNSAVANTIGTQTTLKSKRLQFTPSSKLSSPLTRVRDITTRIRVT